MVRFSGLLHYRLKHIIVVESNLYDIIEDVFMKNGRSFSNMKARLVKDKQEKLWILCSNGSMVEADKNHLNKLLKGFHTIEQLAKKDGSFWNQEYPEMAGYPGHTYAYVTDNYQLVISDFTPFEILFQVDTSLLNLITAAEYGKVHGKSVEQIKVLCRNGRIYGARKIGRDWMIPADAPYPTDGRYSYTAARR